MEIRMTIPKEFEWHFKMDRFKDSLGRINFDKWAVASSRPLGRG